MILGPIGNKGNTYLTPGLEEFQLGYESVLLLSHSTNCSVLMVFLPSRSGIAVLFYICRDLIGIDHSGIYHAWSERSMWSWVWYLRHGHSLVDALLLLLLVFGALLAGRQDPALGELLPQI